MTGGHLLYRLTPALKLTQDLPEQHGLLQLISKAAAPFDGEWVFIPLMTQTLALRSGNLKPETQ